MDTFKIAKKKKILTQIKNGKDFRHFRQFCDPRKKTDIQDFARTLNIPLFEEICSTRLDLPITFNYKSNLS